MATQFSMDGGKVYGRVSAKFIHPRKKEEEDNSDELIKDLFEAITEGNIRLVTVIIKEAKKVQTLLEKKDPQGLTPLRKAIAMSKAEIARILVTHGASPDLRDPMGKTPLHLAVMQGRRELMAPLLVSADSSVNVQDKDGWTPLHYAIRGKHLKVIEWLLYAGADVNLKNKNEESPLEVTEEGSLMKKMVAAFNVDRDMYPVTLASAFIARKDLNYIGTDGLLMFVTTDSWSPNDQFFFCKKIRPSEASPLIPLRWNEFYFSDVYHYRTMRRLNPGQTRVKLYILYFEDFHNSELVLKVTSKEKFLGEVPLLRSTYVQETYTNFIGSCELDIKPEGQFVMVKRYVSIFLRKNEVGLYTCDKYPDFFIEVPQYGLPQPSKDWNTTRMERAIKERNALVEMAERLKISPSSSTNEYLQEFYEQTYVKEETEEKNSDQSVGVPPVFKLGQAASQMSSATQRWSRSVMEDERTEGQAEQEGEEESVRFSIQLEPMVEAYAPDDGDDFYYISRGWGTYLTVIRAFPLSVLLDPATMEKDPIRCATLFYFLSHSSEQNPSKDCTVQIPKTDQFNKIGTVLVFARKAVSPYQESPDPDDSPQEYLLSDDMKTTWGQQWHIQEKDRWSLIPTGICNKHTRVIFKTRVYTAFIVVQLSTGDERSEKEDDASSSSEEEEDVVAGEEEDGEKEDRDDGEIGDLKEEGESKKRKSKYSKKPTASSNSSILGLYKDICLQDEEAEEAEDEMAAEGGEGEGEDEGEDKPSGSSGEAEEGEGEATGTEPVPRARSSQMNKDEANKDGNASNRARQMNAEGNDSGNANNNSSINNQAALDNKNNNQIRDNDENMDQSELAPEEKTIIVGPPPIDQEFAILNRAPSVYIGKGRMVSFDEGPEKEVGEDSASEMKSSMFTGEALTGDFSMGKKTSKMEEEEGEESESDEELPVISKTRHSLAVIRDGKRELQNFKFGQNLSSLDLAGVDMDLVKSHIALMWRFRNHRETRVLIFSRLRGENEFDMVVDVVQSHDTYVRAESLYSQGFKMVGESQQLLIKTGRFLSFVIEGPLLVEKCTGGVSNSQGNPRLRTMYISHSQINTIEYIVKRPQVEEAKGPAAVKKGKKKEEVKVETEPDSRLEVMGFNAGSSTNGDDLANMPIWLNGPDLWQERHVQLRASDDKLLTLLIDCLKKSRAVARNWWKLVILLGYKETHVEKEKGKTAPNLVVAMYVKKWFEDCLNLQDRGILLLIQSLQILGLDIAIENMVRILQVYKANLLLEPVRPRYLKLLFHWVLQTKITKTNLLRMTEPLILRPVSDIFLLHLSRFLPQEHLFKIGAVMEVEENVLHAIAGEEIIRDEAYLGFKVLVKSRQKKDEIIHYTLLLMEMFKQVELPEAHEFMVRETKKWMETVAFTEYDICNKLENVFGS